MKVLFPAWTPARADETKLKTLHDLAVELLMQGVHPDMSAAQMQLLTAKLQGKDLAALKKTLLRPGFVEEWDSLDQIAAGFQKVLLAKENQVPSAAYKLFTSYDPEAVLWLGFTGGSAAVKDRYNLFLKVWPEAKQRIPYALMQEMRITPELPIYKDVVQQVFLELIDGKLTTPEEQKAFLEPHSPPAPPAPVTIKRSRAKRNAEKVKERSFEDEDEAEESLGDGDDLDDLGTDDEEISLNLPGVEIDEEPGGDEEDEDEAPAVAKQGRKEAPASKPAKTPDPKPAKPVNEAAKPAAAKPAVETKPQPAAKHEKTVAKPVSKAAPKPAAKPAPKAPAPKAKPAPAAKKAVTKPAAKQPAKKAVAPKPKAAKTVKVAKPAPAKKKPAPKPVKVARPAAKPAPKKPAGKPGKRH